LLAISLDTDNGWHIAANFEICQSPENKNKTLINGNQYDNLALSNLEINVYDLNQISQINIPISEMISKMNMLSNDVFT